jgi:hypothetical protein
MADREQHAKPVPSGARELPGAHEKTDANTRSLFTAGGALFLLIVVVLGLMWGMLKLLEHYPPEVTTQPPETADRSALPPEPRLQANPALDMQTFRAREDSILTTYGWADRSRGTVRVPIDTAIAMLARRGLPLDPDAVRQAGKQGNAVEATPGGRTGGSEIPSP